MVAVFVNIFMFFLFVVLGIGIKYFKWSWLIAGYNTSSKEEKDKYDEDALCRYIGNLMFALAALMLLSGLGAYLHYFWLMNAAWIIFVIVIIVALIYANTGNRLKK